MKVKILQYCQEKIDGHLTVLDVNKIIDVSIEDASRLITNGIAQEIDCSFDLNNPSLIVNGENKMVNVLYKKRGRPRKEV